MGMHGHPIDCECDYCGPKRRQLRARGASVVFALPSPALDPEIEADIEVEAGRLVPSFLHRLTFLFRPDILNTYTQCAIAKGMAMGVKAARRTW